MAAADASDGRTTRIARAFGAENRARLIGRYFEENGPITIDDAWKHVYALLLWIDKTTGLAHCYESDKSQPGRHWYVRSLEFHGWLSEQFGCKPKELIDRIDWLFRHATGDIAKEIAEARARAAVRQRKPYEGRGFPEAGEDPDLDEIVLDVLGPWLTERPPLTTLRDLAQRIRLHVGQENKRKNLLGEGFEDVLKAVIDQLGLHGVHATTRPLLHTVGGFHEPRAGEKPKKVDLAVVTPVRRELVTAKWSVRADREEQFLTDFGAYATLESAGKPFGYYWLTNEFDPARLVASSDKLVQNAPLFTAVVHISPEGLMRAYGNRRTKKQDRVVQLIDQQRIVSLADWLRSLQTGA